MPLKTAISLPSAKEFAQLTRPEQLSALRMADSRQKSHYLIEVAHGAELMAQLPVQDVYLLVKERGPEHLPEVLELVSPSQWTGFFDLDCWQEDTFDIDKARAWFQLMLQGTDEQVLNCLMEMDFDLLVLLLKQEVLILAGPEDIDDENERHEAMQRDGGYQVTYRDEDGQRVFGALLVLLFDKAPDFARYLLNAVRAEMLSLMVESVYQQRTQRLGDLGFCDPFEARVVYAWLDPGQYRDSQHKKAPLGMTDTGVAPAFAMTLSRPKGLMAEIIRNGLSEELGWELACLANKVALADQVVFSDQEQVHAVVSKVNDTLNLALEWLAGNDLNVAEELLTGCYCEELFRVGFSLTVQRQRRARKILSHFTAAYLEETQLRFLKVLDQKQPGFIEATLSPKYDQVRPFSSLEDLSAADDSLDRLERLQRLFEEGFGLELPAPDEIRLDDCLPVSGDALSLDTLFLTSFANRLLDRPFAPEPISEEELPQLHGLVSAGGDVRPELRQETCEWLESLVPGAAGFGNVWLDRLADEFCQVRCEDLDPRYLGGLIIRLKH